MATFTTLRTKIKSVLDSVTELAFAYDFHRADLEGYPAATFDVASEEGIFLTNKENRRTIAYTIVIYQEVTVAGLDTATNILDAAADAVIAAFEAKVDLDGLVDWCLPLAGPRGQFQTPNGLVAFQQLTLTCNFHIQP